MNLHERFNLTGHRALVTGSTQGIGRAIALALAEFGADVAIHGVEPIEAAQAVAAEATAHGVRAAAFSVDLSMQDAAADLYQQVCAQLGPPDILVSNVAVQHRMNWREITPAYFHLLTQTNLIAGLELMQLCHPAMAAKQWGRILAIGSVQQYGGSQKMMIYSAAKAAQFNMIKSLSRELGKDGITVNSMAPGCIATERNRGMLDDPERRTHTEKQIPLGRLGSPEDCAGAALLLCSDAGSYITGADIIVDGGLLA